jgi:predicted type IV restriction endonuclease
MSLRDTLQTVVTNLQAGRYPNEQATSQMAVFPVLHDLGWDTTNPRVVWPQYLVKGETNGFVDYALCHPEERARVFIEVKQPGNLQGADEQAFGYAVKQGVRMLVLTDGRTWSFYLPGEEGSIEDRRVYRLDLLERSGDEATESLVRYLSYSRIAPGIAIDEAVAQLRDRSRRGLAAATIAAAWGDLLENEDAALFDRLSSEVESKCGVKPDQDDMAEFLRSLAVRVPPAQPARQSAATQPVRASMSAAPGPSYEFRGQSRSFRTAQQMMAGVLQEFTRLDASFPERCYRYPDNTGRRRTYIGKSPEELYPGNPDLQGYSIEFVPGWFVGTNVSNNSKEKIIRMACAVAGVAYGVELKVTF